MVRVVLQRFDRKNASYDGSTIVARTEDSQNGVFTLRSDRVKPEDPTRHYKSVLSTFEIDLPDNPVRYTAVQMPF